LARYDNIAFFRVDSSGAEKIGPAATGRASMRQAKTAVSLVPLKSLSVSSFAFPFGNVLRVRDALKMQNLPYVSAGGMELFPSVIKHGRRSSEGVVWFASSSELGGVQSPMERRDNRVWPAALPLVSEIGGDGATIWIDAENICSMLWRNKVPTFYRWRPRPAGMDDRSAAESETSWLMNYAEAGSEVGSEWGNKPVYVFHWTTEAERLPEIIKASLALCPWIEDVNLSVNALDSVLGLERIVRSLSRAAMWILVMGLLVLVGNAMKYWDAKRDLDGLRDRSSDLYRSAFDPSRSGRIADPLGLARSKMAELRGGTSTGRTLPDVLEDLGGIFERNPSMDVQLDSMRYTADGVDYTGTAKEMDTVQQFREAWAEKAAAVPFPNLRSAPGIGYRFDLSVRW
jgi:hypothetical protein